VRSSSSLADGSIFSFFSSNHFGATTFCRDSKKYHSFGSWRHRKRHIPIELKGTWSTIIVQKSKSADFYSGDFYSGDCYSA